MALVGMLHIRGIDVSEAQANALRRAEKVLLRWSAQECGNSDKYKSWAIERDEMTDKPFICIYPYQGESRRYPIADREKGALARVAAVCKAAGLYFYHQGDPRGVSLYVSNAEMTDSNYSSVGVAISF